MTGERVSWRPSRGRLTQLSVVTGYYGEYREPNVFERADRLGDWNYGQVLAGFRVSSRVQASVDYTYEDGRDIIREGVTVRMLVAVTPSTIHVLDRSLSGSTQRELMSFDRAETTVQITKFGLSRHLNLAQGERRLGLTGSVAAFSPEAGGDKLVLQLLSEPA